MLAPVLLDTVVAHPVRSCPRQLQLHVRIVQWVNMNLLKTMTFRAYFAHQAAPTQIKQLAPSVSPDGTKTAAPLFQPPATFVHLDNTATTAPSTPNTFRAHFAHQAAPT